MIASVTYDGTGHVGRGTVVGGIAELSAQTGHPLVNCDSFGRLDHGRFTALPGSAPQTATAAAW